jgi:DNA topoisomerase IA
MSKANEYLPEFTEGEVVPVTDAKLADGQTSPPDYLTEAELIELMVSRSGQIHYIIQIQDIRES